MNKRFMGHFRMFTCAIYRKEYCFLLHYIFAKCVLIIGLVSASGVKWFRPEFQADKDQFVWRISSSYLLEDDVEDGYAAHDEGDDEDDQEESLGVGGSVRLVGRYHVHQQGQLQTDYIANHQRQIHISQPLRT